ncbi:hypothetical protein NKI51_28890 [Mesorhizobium australicum]|uniref:hypothetical protein n=1 Tax=Mesorhizobium australicum TaxID=536018 RepID=UPI003339EE6C
MADPLAEVRRPTVKVRVWYGRATAQGWEAWKDWDGYTFQTDRAALTKERTMQLSK